MELIYQKAKMKYAIYGFNSEFINRDGMRDGVIAVILKSCISCKIQEKPKNYEGIHLEKLTKKKKVDTRINHGSTPRKWINNPL